jgi:hypothetical protein
VHWQSRKEPVWIPAIKWPSVRHPDNIVSTITPDPEDI